MDSPREMDSVYDTQKPTLTQLIITILGPFAYAENYPETGDLTIMAPMCPHHLCGISSIEANRQFVLPQFNCKNHPSNFGGCKAHSYELRFNAAQIPSSPWTGNFLKCSRPVGGFNPKAWRFWLKLPRPTKLIAVNPVEVEVIAPPGPEVPQPGPFAVAARLFYEGWDGEPVSLWYRGDADQSFKPAHDLGGPVLFKFSDHGNHSAYLEIEYASPLRDDTDHEDAVDCFENLMGALGLPWSVYLKPLGSPEVKADDPTFYLLASRLSDCTAPIARVL